MCFFYSVKKEKSEELVINNLITQHQLSLIEDVYFANGFSHLKMPVLVREYNENYLKYYSWGLIPGFYKTESEAERFRNMNLNARSETIFEKKSFENAAKKMRCLVLCSGFFEFYDGGGKKYPFFISLKNNGLFVFAGIWDSWINRVSGETVHTFSILTQETNSLIGALHKKHRMPVFLNFDDAQKYINPETSQSKIIEITNKRIEFEKLKAQSIARFNPKMSEQNNVEKISAFYSYPELSQYFRYDKDFNDEIRSSLLY
jgi:putative SOS response-associated peptidase YedK